MAGPNDFTSQNIQDTYQRVLQISGTQANILTDGTGSLVTLGADSVVSSSYAISASYALSASHEITYELSSSYAETASYVPDAVMNINTGTGNSVTATTFDGTTYTRTISSVGSSDCADKVKTIACDSADVNRYLTFVDDNNSLAECETVRTNENIMWNCRTRTLIVQGAIKSKGSDITMMSGSISASGAITASNVSMSGDMVATTGSFNHIVTDGDTIEFREAGTTTKLGHLKFSDKGAEFGDSAGTGKSNLTASIILATSKFVSEGSAEFSGDVTMSGHFSASGELDTSKIRTGKMVSISPDGTDLQFGNDTNGTRIHGDFIQLGNPSLTTQIVTSSGDIVAPKFVVSGSTINSFSHGNLIIAGNDAVGGHLAIRGGLDASGTPSIIDGYIDSDNGLSILLNGGAIGNSGSFNIYNAINTSALPGVNSTNIFSINKAGHVTASGNISSSGLVYSSGYWLDDNMNAVQSNSSTPSQLQLGFSNNWTSIMLGKGPTPIFTDGSITSSANISASGNIFGDNISAATKFIGTELEGSSITLDSAADITLDAAGDQIYMKDNGTDRFTFNLDSTPQIDIAGDLIIAPTGLDLGVKGRLKTYITESTDCSNYAYGGMQGYQNHYCIPGTDFVGQDPSATVYRATGGIGATGNNEFYASFMIPQGMIIEGIIVLANDKSSVKFSSTLSTGACSNTDTVSLLATKCPAQDPGATWSSTYTADMTVLTAAEQAKFIGSDLNIATIKVLAKNKFEVYAAFLFLSPRTII